MKNFLIVVLFLLPTITTHAQEDTTQVKKTRELALNATTFINNFFSFNENQPDPGRYLLSYRVYSKKGKIFRFGLNFDLDDDKTKEEDSINEGNSKTTLLSLRAGMEKQFNIKKRWTVSLGYDIFAGTSKTTSKDISKFEFNVPNAPSFIITNEDKLQSYNLGSGPYVAIQFKFNDRIGFFTETTFYHNYTKTETETSTFNTQVDSENNSSSNTSSKNFKFNIGLPNALFFYMKF